MWTLLARSSHERREMVGDPRNKAELLLNGKSAGSFGPHEWGAMLKMVADRDMLSGRIGIRHHTPDGPRTFYPAVAYMLGAPAFAPPNYLAPRSEPRTD